MNRGFFKFFRKIEDNRSWSRGAIYRGVMASLLQKANWKPSYFLGELIAEGEVALSGKSFADELCIDRRTLLRVFDELEKDGFITRQNVHNRFTLITITNWHTYQVSGEGACTTNAQLLSQPMLFQDHTSKEDKNLRIKKKTYTPAFLQFWQAYPKRVAKDAAFKAWLSRRDDLPAIEILLDILERHKQSEQWLRDEGKYIPYPSTWLNQGRWLDVEGTNSNANRPEWAQGLGEIL